MPTKADARKLLPTFEALIRRRAGLRRGERIATVGREHSQLAAKAELESPKASRLSVRQDTTKTPRGERPKANAPRRDACPHSPRPMLPIKVKWSNKRPPSPSGGIRYGVVANIARSHRAAQGSIPCTGDATFLFFCLFFVSRLYCLALSITVCLR